MAGIGVGYDLSVCTFSPDGRIFQIEYAAKATENGCTVMGITCKDGVLLAAESLLLHRMTVPGSASKIFLVDKHCAVAVAGFISDGREIVRRARLEAKEYKRVYDDPIPGHVLSQRLALFVHAYTLAWSERPFGTALILAVWDSDSQPQYSLYHIDTFGTSYKYYAIACGKGRQTAKNQIEKFNCTNMTCEEAKVAAAKIMHSVHEETRDRYMELDLAFISDSTNGVFRKVDPADSQELLKQVEAELSNEEAHLVDVPAS